MGKRSREKGAAAERAAAQILRLIHHGAKRRVSGEEGQGENLGRDLRGTPGLCIQVKETGAPAPMVALEEAIAASVGYEIPIAIVRQARRDSSTPFRVIMRLDDFLYLETVRLAYQDAFPIRHLQLREELDALLRDLAAKDASIRARIGECAPPEPDDGLTPAQRAALRGPWAK